MDCRGPRQAKIHVWPGKTRESAGNQEDCTFLFDVQFHFFSNTC